ncbi:MAG: radical SAM protein [Candidatus Lokiarchaeota archaeon]|nr:radical SAM protein [Candidatus Lokiarchaeota archaeon]MBD3198478.1 radical SAM protein [Candidatus Lokiarchaeota archaeon]
MTEEIIRETTSLCPECLHQIPAEIYVDPKTNWVMMRKNCKDHGEFKDKLSINPDEYKWAQNFTKEIGSVENNSTKPVTVSSGIKPIKNGCPYDCGICDNHESAPCICLIDVTNKCNLSCPICFANASAKGYVVQPTYDQIVQIMEHFRSMKPHPAPMLQLAGGEPTVREDLPKIIRKAKELGFIEVMVSTNGVRMGKSLEYTRKLHDAGVDAVYLQFDATDDPETWKKVRGVNLWPLKKKVIEHCREVGQYGVMLVPTVAKGVNDHQIGAILEYAKNNADVISGVVFQPVSLCGRISFEELMDLRYTTSDLKKAINESTNGAVTRFYPIATTGKLTKLLAWFDNKPEWAMLSHKDCGFATICVVDEHDNWRPIEDFFDVEGLIGWANKVYDMVYNKEVPKPTGLLKGVDLSKYGVIAETVGKFVDDVTGIGYRQVMKAYFFGGLTKHVKNPEKIFTNKTYQSFAKLILNPSLDTAGNFLHTKNLLISCMHFQDAYNFDLNRVKHCLVHYGVIDPNDSNKVLEIPFCAMNTVHRENIERKLALQDEEAEKPEVIQQKMESLLDSIKE